MSLKSTPPKVLISYSHNYDSPDYKDRIWDLADRLLELLYRRLTNQPRIRKPELGKLQTLAPRDRKQNFPISPVEVVLSGVENTEDNEECDLDSKISWEDRKNRLKNIGFQECKKYPDFFERKPIDPLDDYFCVENEYVQIQSYLPNLNKINERNKDIFCGNIVFKDERFKDSTSSFNSSILLNTYFKTYKLPLEDRIFSVFHVEDCIKCHCIIGGSNVFLSKEEAQSLCDALDWLYEKYKEQIDIIEKQWRSSNFEILSGFEYKIPLIRITQQLWSWQPPYNPEAEHHNQFSSRYYWDVETTYDWLVNELIPYALFWNKEICQTHKLVQFFKKASYENFLKEYNKNDYVIHSYKEKPFQVGTVKELNELVSKLQGFYYHIKPYHFSAQEYSNLYKSLFLSLTYSS